MQGIEKFSYNEATCSVDYSFWLATFESYLETSFIDYTASNESDCFAGLTLVQVCGKHIQQTLSAHDGNWRKLPFSQMKTILKDRYVVQNVRMDAYRFSCLRLEAGESLSDYVARLRPLALVIDDKNSDNEIIKKLIQDPSIAEMANGQVLNKLLKPMNGLRAIIDWATTEDLKLTLKTNTIVSSTCLNQLLVPERRNSTRHSSASSRNSSNSNNSYKNKAKECFYCGYDFPHVNRNDNKCLAAKARCSNVECGEIGHFIKCCPKKTGKPLPKKRVYQITDVNLDPHNDASLQQVKYINSVTSQRSPKHMIRINGAYVTITADTGAEVNVFGKQTYLEFAKKPNLSKCTARLMAFNGKEHIKTLGQFVTEMTWFNITKKVEIIVIDSEHQVDNLICYQTMLDFNVDFNKVFKHNSEQHIRLIKIPHQIISNDPLMFTGKKLREFVLDNWKKSFEHRVGKVEGKQNLVKINFNMSIPFIRCPPQAIALHLLEPTHDKILEWQHNTVVKPVEYSDELTWVSPLNPVEKDHGKPTNVELTCADIRLTCNFKNLNKLIKYRRKKETRLVHVRAQKAKVLRGIK